MKTPDTQGWVILGIFALAFAELAMIGTQPALAENKLFFALSTATWTGGVLLVATFFFGSSKGSAAKDDTIAVMANTQAANPPPPAPPPPADPQP